jgi:predicted nucleic acid-binding protein
VDDLDVVIHRTDADALERAAVLACQRSLRFFDALFAECAIQRELTLITADAKFCKAVNGLLFTELLRGISTS